MAGKQIGSSEKRTLARYIPVIYALAALLLVAPLTRISDPDGLYHFAHARAYVAQGPLHAGFEWHSVGSIAQYGSDLWYGFHLLLIPFTFLPDPVMGVKIATSACLGFYLIAFYFALRRLQAPWPWLWPLLTIAAGPMHVGRELTLRPYLLSVGFCALLFAAIAAKPWPPEEEDEKPKFDWELPLYCFLIPFIHASFFWLPLVVAIVAGAKRWYGMRLKALAPLGTALVASVIGLLARPAPMGGLKLLWIQLGELSKVVAAKIPLHFGSEVTPLGMQDISDTYMILVGVWLLLVIAAAWAIGTKRAKVGSAWASALVLTLGFLFISVRQSFRGVDLWVPFTVVSIALSAGVLASAFGDAAPGKGPSRGAIAAGLVVGAWTLWAVPSGLKMLGAMGLNPYRLDKVGIWLREHATEGEVVYHTHWSDFPELFFWDSRNHYITGMDPIFLYAADPGLYWKYHRIEDDVATLQTSAEPPPSTGGMEDIATVLRRDFHASLIVVLPSDTPQLAANLAKDSRFQEVYRDDNTVVYRIP